MIYTLLKQNENGKWSVIKKGDEHEDVEWRVDEDGIYLIEEVSFEQGHYGVEEKTEEVARFINGRKVES